MIKLKDLIREQKGYGVDKIVGQRSFKNSLQLIFSLDETSLYYFPITRKQYNNIINQDERYIDVIHTSSPKYLTNLIKYQGDKHKQISSYLYRNDFIDENFMNLIPYVFEKGLVLHLNAMIVFAGKGDI